MTLPVIMLYFIACIADRLRIQAGMLHEHFHLPLDFLVFFFQRLIFRTQCRDFILHHIDGGNRTIRILRFTFYVPI